MKSRNGMPFRQESAAKPPHCCYCGIPLTLEIATIEHLLPRGKGGNNGLKNKRWCCASCNTLRGSRPLFNFRLEIEAKLAIIPNNHNHPFQIMVENIRSLEEYVDENKKALTKQPAKNTSTPDENAGWIKR